MRRNADASLLRNAGVLLGLGLGGFCDGIVLHQLLQWHHLVSNVDDFDPATLPGLRANIVADGLFHALTYALTVTGVVLFWMSMQRGQRGTGREVVGLLLVGWGAFNIADSLIAHFLLGIHHINMTAPPEQWLWWDLAFLGLGVAMLATGWRLWRAAP
jgi:uncharacterized membrane protein